MRPVHAPGICRGLQPAPPRRDPNADPKSADYSDVHCPNAAWLEERTLVLYTLQPTYNMRLMRKVVKAVGKCIDAYRK